MLQETLSNSSISYKLMIFFVSLQHKRQNFCNLLWHNLSLKCGKFQQKIISICISWTPVLYQKASSVMFIPDISFTASFRWPNQEGSPPSQLPSLFQFNLYGGSKYLAWAYIGFVIWNSANKNLLLQLLLTLSA